MRILLAIGHCNEEVMHQAGRVAATHTQAGPILSVRTRQQMEGVPQRHLEPVHFPNASGNMAKRARDHAKTLSEQIG